MTFHPRVFGGGASFLGEWQIQCRRASPGTPSLRCLVAPPPFFPHSTFHPPEAQIYLHYTRVGLAGVSLGPRVRRGVRRRRKEQIATHRGISPLRANGLFTRGRWDERAAKRPPFWASTAKSPSVAPQVTGHVIATLREKCKGFSFPEMWAQADRGSRKKGRGEKNTQGSQLGSIEDELGGIRGCCGFFRQIENKRTLLGGKIERVTDGEIISILSPFGGSFNPERCFRSHKGKYTTPPSTTQLIPTMGGRRRCGEIEGSHHKNEVLRALRIPVPFTGTTPPILTERRPGQ